jgi:hypothetical protein
VIHETGARSQKPGVQEIGSCGVLELRKCGIRKEGGDAEQRELLNPGSWLLFLEFFVEMSAGAEVAIGNLKDLRGDRPWIIVVQTKH